MTFWTSERLKAEGHLRIRPFDPGQVVNCSYELTLGPEAYITGNKGDKKQSLKATGDEVIIPPGQFALLLSEESVRVPHDAIGLISLKSGFKLHGLVNVSGFHVDPGFDGRLIFSVYNAGGSDVRISRGQRLFLIWFASLEGTTAYPYTGDRSGQERIPSNDIEAIGGQHYSPADFDRRLTNVEVQVGVALGLVIALLVGLVLALLGPILLRQLSDGEPEPSPGPTRILPN